MGKLRTTQGDCHYLWASDVDFDGIRLEVYDFNGDNWFEISVPKNGGSAINTYMHDVPAEIVLAALSEAERKT